MSKEGITLTVLATGLAEAVGKDEAGDGCDLSAGLFGEHASQWLRDVAAFLSERAEPSATKLMLDTAQLIRGRPELRAAFVELWHGGEGVGKKWRHVATARPYYVVGRGRLQCAAPPEDGAAVVIYQGTDGAFWARPEAEFEARFEREPEPKRAGGA